MLVVKIDNSRSSDDHSVEVEYGSGNETEKRKSSPAKKKSSRRSPTKQKQHQQQPQFQDAEVPNNKSATSPPVLATMSSQDSSNYEGRPSSLSQSLSVGSTDEWEDMTGTDSDMHATTTEDEGESYKRGSARLNPEAPVFLPTSADLLMSPPGTAGFDAAPKEQRSHRSPVSRSLSGTSSRSSSSMASRVTSEPASPDLKPAPPKSFSSCSESTTNGRQAHEVEEDEDEKPTPEKEVLGDGHEDLEQDHEEEEEEEDHFFDSADKVEKVAGEENGLLTERSTDYQEEEEQQEDDSSQEVSSLADELSAAAHPGDVSKDTDSPPGTVASSLADELCAAGASLHSSSPPQPQVSVQDHLSSQEVYEIEEDDVEEETEPTVCDDTVLKGEALPNTATASNEVEERKPASPDADSSCQAAPGDSACSSPKQSGKQMAASEEDGGSQDGAEEPSSQLTSMGSDSAQESGMVRWSELCGVSFLPVVLCLFACLFCLCFPIFMSSFVC